MVLLLSQRRTMHRRAMNIVAPISAHGSVLAQSPIAGLRGPAQYTE